MVRVLPKRTALDAPLSKACYGETKKREHLRATSLTIALGADDVATVLFFSSLLL
jgi:hypothetical protein